MQKYEFFGEIPAPRFGHTVTQITKTKVLLFGGATGDVGKYAITNEIYLLDLITRKWRRIDPQGPILPCERAAHATVSVDSLQIVTYGGATGGGNLAPDELFLLDLRNGEDKSFWILIPIMGITPGKRYGHSLSFNRPYLLIFGGNTGNESANDIWLMNVEKSPFTWVKWEGIGEAPIARVYHSAALSIKGSTNGMIIMFGGRGENGNPLNDMWGFRKHKDGKWDWIRAPGGKEKGGPIARYQHSNLVLDKVVFIIGGRTNNVNDTIPLDIFDTETSEWFSYPGIERFRQSNWIFENHLYLHGGLHQTNPNIPVEEVNRLDLLALFENNSTVQKIFCQVESVHNGPFDIKSENNAIKYGPGSKFYRTSINPSKKSPLLQQEFQIKPLRLAEKAFIATSFTTGNHEVDVIRKLSIIKLQDESKRLNNNDPNNSQAIANLRGSKKCGLTSQNLDELCDYFLEKLLKNVDTQTETILLDKEQIELLCKEVHSIFEREKTLLKLKSPMKIFGNLHGQFGDLLRLFELFGTPYDSSLQGDIDGFSYVFLGDYVDYGYNSIEVLCLLFTLKIKFPDSIFLLRGHHEDPFINRIFGFAEECVEKFNENIDDPNSIYQKINRIFESLPLAAVIDDTILALHGGIGSSIRTLADIEMLERPIEINHEPTTFYEKVVLDILLSDPITENIEKSKSNPNREFKKTKCVIKYGLDRIFSFLANNKLKNIIRGHEFAQQGFDAFANESVLTICSCLNYGNSQNAACVFTIKKNYDIIPKILNYNGPESGQRWRKKEDFEKFMDLNYKKEDFIVYNGVKLSEEQAWLKRKEYTPLRSRVSDT